MLEASLKPWWGFIVLGIVGGTISGMLGVGSGLVLIPALVILFALPQKSAQGTALVVMVPMALVGATRYWVDPAIDVNLAYAGLIIAGAVAGVMLGFEVASRVPGGILKKVFAIFIMIVAVRMLLTTGGAGESSLASLSNPWWAFVLLGIAAGVISGMLGVGSGVILIPALVILFAFPQKSAQGTALMVMVPMALVGAIRYRLHPQIKVSLRHAGLIIAGAIVGSLIGSEVAARVPASMLKKVFAVFIMIVALKMLLTHVRLRGTRPDTEDAVNPNVTDTKEEEKEQQ